MIISFDLLVDLTFRARNFIFSFWKAKNELAVQAALDQAGCGDAADWRVCWLLPIEPASITVVTG